MSADNGRD